MKPSRDDRTVDSSVSQDYSTGDTDGVVASEGGAAGAWNGLRRDTLWQLAERGVRVGLGFVTTVFVARALGPDGFGIFSYALATVALFAFLGQAGIDALLLREIIRFPSRNALVLGEGLVLRCVGAVCAAVLSICAAVLGASSETEYAVTLVCILSLSGVLQAGWVVESLLIADRRFAGVAIAKMSAYAFATCLRFIAIALPDPLIYLALATVMESLFCLVFLWTVSRRQLSIGWTSLARPECVHVAALARLAAPMLVSAFTVAVYSRIDVFMLGRMIGSEASGLYSAGVLLSEGFYLVPAAVMAAVGPRLARRYLRDVERFHRELQQVLRMLSVTGLAIALIVTVSAPYLISSLFGDDYVDAVSVLKIHIWSTWAVFVSTASDPYYINHDLRRFYLFKTSIAAILNLVLNLVLIPGFGTAGAAWATLVAYVTSAILVTAFSGKTRPLFEMQLRAIVGLLLPHASGRSVVK